MYKHRAILFSPKLVKVHDFGLPILFTNIVEGYKSNVKIMLRRYVLSLTSRKFVKCQTRLLNLDAVAPIGTSLEKDANYKVTT
jgi:hypothetical protein